MLVLTMQEAAAWCVWEIGLMKSSRRSLLFVLEGILELKLSCPEVTDEDNETASPRFSLRLSWELLSSEAPEHKETRRSASFTDPSGSLQAWLATMVMLLASLWEMISGLLPGDCTLTPRRCVEWSRGMVEEWGDTLPALGRGEDEGCKHLADGDSKGEGGLMWKDVPRSVLSVLLVRLSLVPRVQVLTGEGEWGNWCWAPTSRECWPVSDTLDAFKLSGSESSPNGETGWGGTTNPEASSNKPRPTASSAGSPGSKVAFGGPLMHRGGSWG